MMDLSNAFDSMLEGVMLAKLSAYRVDEKYCSLIFSFPFNINQYKSNWVILIVIGYKYLGHSPNDRYLVLRFTISI